MRRAAVAIAATNAIEWLLDDASERVFDILIECRRRFVAIATPPSASGFDRASAAR
jgi:hypothetical protein